MVKVTCDICGAVMETPVDPCYCEKCCAILDGLDMKSLAEKAVRSERRKQDVTAGAKSDKRVRKPKILADTSV